MKDATRAGNTAITNENPEQESFISEISPGILSQMSMFKT